MASDVLGPAYALQAAQEVLAAALIVDGAVPLTAEARLGVDLEVGQIVRDRVSGQVGEVVSVTRPNRPGPPQG